MKRSDVIHAAIVTVCMILIMLASSTKAHASSKSMDNSAITAAHARYHSRGVVVAAATCVKHGRNWKCVWLGADKDGYAVYGRLGRTPRGWFVITPMRSGTPDHV